MSEITPDAAADLIPDDGADSANTDTPFSDLDPSDPGIIDDMIMMGQTTLDLVAILDLHKDSDAETVMAGLMQAVQDLEAADAAIRTEMRGNQAPDIIFKAMIDPMAIVTRHGARDLDMAARRATSTFSDILGTPGPLTAEAKADIMVWLTIAQQTMIALRLLFQTARLYGRAPNGQRLES